MIYMIYNRYGSSTGNISIGISLTRYATRTRKSRASWAEELKAACEMLEMADEIEVELGLARKGALWLLVAVALARTGGECW